jgi:hypothetical protein
MGFVRRPAARRSLRSTLLPASLIEVDVDRWNFWFGRRNHVSKSPAGLVSALFKAGKPWQKRAVQWLTAIGN